jgi:hypothetical protein
MFFITAFIAAIVAQPILGVALASLVLGIIGIAINVNARRKPYYQRNYPSTNTYHSNDKAEHRRSIWWNSFEVLHSCRHRPNVAKIIVVNVVHPQTKQEMSQEIISNGLMLERSQRLCIVHFFSNGSIKLMTKDTSALLFWENILQSEDFMLMGESNHCKSKTQRRQAAVKFVDAVDVY